MTEQEWLASNDPVAMLNFVRGRTPGVCTERRLRLFACACYELCGYPAGDGCNQAWYEWQINNPEKPPNVWDGWETITSQTIWPVCVQRGSFDALIAVCLMLGKRNECSALLRDIFGNPYRSQSPSHTDKCLDSFWSDPTVLSLAQAIYDDRAFDRMPILADALEEEGCQDEAILRHCRDEESFIETSVPDCPSCNGTGDETYLDPCTFCGGTGKLRDAINMVKWRPLRGPHVRGCWALDLILGKE